MVTSKQWGGAPLVGVVIFGVILLCVNLAQSYNPKYPLTSPFKKGSVHTYRIGIIADLDQASKSTSEKSTWLSYLKKGYLKYSADDNSVTVHWDPSDPIELKSGFSIKDRGMELSELLVYDGKLLTFDDRTGLVFEIADNEVLPWVMLVDGDGRASKGFKSEWATIKNKLIYVGSHGKELVTRDGEFESANLQYIKTISPEGVIKHIDWREEYNRLRAAIDIFWPGYMTHESGVWSEEHQKWFFLPRKCSKLNFNYTADEFMGCSWLLSADAKLDKIESVEIPNLENNRGFSSFKFIPSSGDKVIVALRSVEVGDETATYITAFTIDGKVLLEDSFISDLKFEGFEFI